MPRDLLAPISKRLPPCCWSPLSFPLSEIPPTSGQKIQVPLLTPTQPSVLHPNARWHTRLRQERCQALLPFSPPLGPQKRDGEPAQPDSRLPCLLQLPWSSAPLTVGLTREVLVEPQCAREERTCSEPVPCAKINKQCSGLDHSCCFLCAHSPLFLSFLVGKYLVWPGLLTTTE